MEMLSVFKSARCGQYSTEPTLALKTKVSYVVCRLITEIWKTRTGN